MPKDKKLKPFMDKAEIVRTVAAVLQLVIGITTLIVVLVRLG